MRVASVAAVSPTTTGSAIDERAAPDRDRIREQQERAAEQRQVQPARQTGVGSRLDRKV
jgi:hypothetical protein